MQQAAARLSGPVGHRTGRIPVDAEGEFPFLFRLVHLGVGGAVDHPVRPVGSDALGHGFWMGEIEFLAIYANDIFPRCPQHQQQFPSQLPGRAGDQDLHAGPS